MLHIENKENGEPIAYYYYEWVKFFIFMWVNLYVWIEYGYGSIFPVAVREIRKWIATLKIFEGVGLLCEATRS